MCIACARYGLDSWHVTHEAGAFAGAAAAAPGLGPPSAPPAGSGPTSYVPASGDPFKDSLIAGSKWGGVAGSGTTVEYSFPGSGGTPVWRSGYGYGEPWDGFGPLNDVQKAAVRSALQKWSDVANIRFVEVAESATSVGDIRFAFTNKTSFAWAYYPSTGPEGGDVWFGNGGLGSSTTFQRGTYDYFVILHEVGHALGLKHPHGTDGTGRVLSTAYDYLGNTLMSYRDYTGDDVTDGVSLDHFPTSPMLLDIQTIQHLYGANMSTRTGNDTYGWASGQRVLEAIWDAGGIDTISWANQSADAVIRLTAGSWSLLGQPYSWWEDGGGSYLGTLAIAYGVTIENAVGGSGNDTLEGNAVANGLDGLAGNDTIRGGNGNDTLWGRVGADRISGELGNDTLAGGPGNDTVDGGAGTDLATFFDATAGVTASLVTDIATGGAGGDTLIAIENLAGSPFNDALTGSEAANTLLGGGGNDVLQGRGGNDLLDGDGGNDVLVGGPGADRLQGDGGADRFDFDAVAESGLGAARDVVQDFVRSQGDRIDLSTIDANLGAAGDQAFAFRGTSALTGAAQVRVAVSGGITLIQVSNDADVAPEMEIQLTGIVSLVAADLVL